MKVFEDPAKNKEEIYRRLSAKKRVWPVRQPVYSPLAPKPEQEDKKQIDYWIGRCLQAEDALALAERRLTEAETRIAELKLDRELILRETPRKRVFSYEEVY